MAHFARINASSIVEDVLVIDNAVLLDAAGSEQESLGVQFCQHLFGLDTVWIQTSYNGSIRKNFAGVGFRYEPSLDAFVPPRSYPSWVLDEATCLWQPPVPFPEDYDCYQWDEDLGFAVKVGVKYRWSEELVDWVSDPFPT
jgi:hypothetical protein